MLAHEVVLDPEGDPEGRRDIYELPLGIKTMVGQRRLESVESMVADILRDSVPGDMIETGVWRGGTTIFLRGLLRAHGVTDRTVYVADSFQGLPPPDVDRYPADAGLDFHLVRELAVSLEEVQASFARYGLLDDQVRFVQGWFRDTLPGLAGHPWSLLRLDGDLYESTMDALTNLYPSLSVGGWIVIDDFSIDACAKAVDDFRADQRDHHPDAGDRLDRAGLAHARRRPPRRGSAPPPVAELPAQALVHRRPPQAVVQLGHLGLQRPQGLGLGVDEHAVAGCGGGPGLAGGGRRGGGRRPGSVGVDRGRDDELVGVGLGHRLDGGHRARRQVRLGHLERHADGDDRAVELVDAQSGFGEDVLDRLAGEEAQVRPVEDAHVRVLEVAVEQREAHAPVGHVGDRRHHAATRAEEAGRRREEAARVAQVLEDVGGEHHVELVVAHLGGEVARVQIADHHALAVGRRPSRGPGIELDADHRAAVGDEELGGGADAAADVEHALAGPHEGHDDPGTVGVAEVDDLVALGRLAPGRRHHRPVSSRSRS